MGSWPFEDRLVGGEWDRTGKFRALYIGLNNCQDCFFRSVLLTCAITSTRVWCLQLTADSDIHITMNFPSISAGILRLLRWTVI